QADRISLKNLASQARTELDAVEGLGRGEAEEIADELADLVDDDGFWDHQAAGLAVFVTPYHVTVFRLPQSVTTQVHVSDRAYLKPLLGVTSHPSACNVLALSEGGVRLIEVPADLPPSTIRIKELPRDAASAAGKASIGARSHSGRLVGSEGKRTHIRHYSRQIDAALRPILAGSDTPLVLAAVEPIRSIYQSMNSYPHLLDQAIETNPDRATDQDLAHAAREVLEASYRQTLKTLAELVDTRRGQRRVSNDVAEAARAATAGAVDTLMMDRDHVLEGSMGDDGSVRLGDEPGAQTYGVIDEIARRVLLTGGTVLSVASADLPDAGQPLTAILRYPF
ncbi:MAG: hypothetical protein ABI112_04900, partial [Terracoccus sp.]